MSALELDGLAFGYGSRTVGSGVSLTLKPGEVLCLLGPNGSGKTTMFKTILGLIAPLSGTVRIGGEDTGAWPRARVARHIGYVPQAQPHLFPYTVLDMVLMGRTAHLGLFAMPSAADHALALRMVQSMGIGHLATQAYTRISGGERQLTLIARALAQQSQILVMDEPTASLDFGNQVRVLQRIGELTRGGLATILSTHDPDHAFMVADRVALLHGGRIAALGTPHETITAEMLQRIYGVEVEVIEVGAVGRRVCVPCLGGPAGGPAGGPS